MISVRVPSGISLLPPQLALLKLLVSFLPIGSWSQLSYPVSKNEVNEYLTFCILKYCFLKNLRNLNKFTVRAVSKPEIKAGSKMSVRKVSTASNRFEWKAVVFKSGF
jgi:hypothetical protein